MALDSRAQGVLGLGKPLMTAPDTHVPPLEDTNDFMAGRDTPSERPTGGDASGQCGGSDAGSPSAASTPRGGESRAARLAKLRQERSMQRISTTLKGAVEREDPAQRAAQAELLCTLRAEVRASARASHGPRTLYLPRCAL